MKHSGWIAITLTLFLMGCEGQNPGAAPQPEATPSSSPSAQAPEVTRADKVRVSTYAGTGEFGYQDGAADQAQFYHPNGLGFDPQGNLYVGDRINHLLRKITPDGQVSTVTGTGAAGNIDGSLEEGRLNHPLSVFAPADKIYILDTLNHSIRLIEGDSISTFVGKVGVSGFVDGTLDESKFNWPSDMVQDSKGNFFVSDRLNHRIRKITPSGEVSTFAGAGLSGFIDGSAEKALFNEPMSLAIDAQDNLFVADTLNHRIRKITPSGEVSTLAGSGQQGSRDDSQALRAEFRSPSGIVVSKSGKVYVSDRFNHLIRVISPTGEVSTLAGSSVGYADAEGTEAQFSYPFQLALDAEENLYIADHGNHAIRKITLSNP